MARNNNENGFIYILTNTHIPKIYKIGYTKRDSTTRAKEISKGTGVPGEWIVARDWPVVDAYQTEQYIFAEFKRYRISKKNEMFDFQGKTVEHVIKKMDNLLLKKQQNLKDYIEKLEKERLGIQKAEARNKEAILEVEKALEIERFDTDYISRIINTIDKMSRKTSFTEIERVKNESKQLDGYKYGTLGVAVVLALWFNIESYAYYIFCAIVLFFLFLSTTNVEDEAKRIHQKNSSMYLEYLPRDMEALKPIMARLKIKRVICINQISVSIKADTKQTILEATHKGLSFRQTYTGSEKSALIKFMIYLKAQ